MLHFDARPPLSSDQLIALAHDRLPERDLAFLKQAVLLKEHEYAGAQPTLQAWASFNRRLKNELVRIRAGRKHLDPLKYARADGYAEQALVHVAANACRNPSLLEAEQLLDRERWQFLEELGRGHFFDIDALLVYGLKLTILTRWEQVRSADAQKLFAAAMPSATIV